METSTINVFAELAKQGPLITALMVAIVYFYRRQNRLEETAQKQSEKIEDLLKEDRKEMIQIIENNTRVMKENTEIITKLSKLHFLTFRDDLNKGN